MDMDMDKNELEVICVDKPRLENVPLDIWDAFITTLYEKALDCCIEN